MPNAIAIAAATVAAIAAAPATAVTLDFELTGVATARFQLDSEQVPNQVDPLSNLFIYTDVAGVYDGVAGIADFIVFYAGFAGGGLDIYSDSLFLIAGGPQLYEGTIYSPIFSPNVYSLDFDSYTLTISAVPEPASWAMLIGGFGLAGAALRERRRRIPIYAAS